MNKKLFGPLVGLAIMTAITAPGAGAAFGQDTKPVTFGKTATFEHESKWFSIDMPTAWSSKDTSKEGEEAIVTFADPTENAAIVVDVFPIEKAFDEDAKTEFVLKFVNDRFEKFTKFSHGDPKTFKDDSVGLGFSYQQKLGKLNVTMLGESYVQTYDDKMMSLITFLIPKEQYDAAKASAYKLIDSFQANPDALASSTVEEMSDLVKYTHPKKVFSIEVPGTWKVTDKSKTGSITTIFSNPDGYSFVMVEAVKNTKATLKAKELVAAVEKYVADTIGKNVADFSAGKSKSVNANVASQTFSFTISGKNGKSTEMAGIMYMFQAGNTISFLRIAVPTDSIKVNGDKLDAIGDSFAVNKSIKF